jgi:proline iminopeptidase
VYVSGLFVDEIGDGPPVVVLHGGPDFDHTYLRPELDRLAASARLVYYDQRGRGRSAPGVQADDISIESDVADVEALRHGLGLDTVAVLGHSWGGVLAMEYATRHPEHVSHLVLMNTAPVWRDGWIALRLHLAQIRSPSAIARMRELEPMIEAGDLNAEREYHRLHFAVTVADADLLDRIVERLRTHFTSRTMRLARAIEDHLYAHTARLPGYDLRPLLRELAVPTLVLHGERDFIPIDVAREVAGAIPGARLVVVPGAGHFTYAEQPDAVHTEVAKVLAEGGNQS